MSLQQLKDELKENLEHKGVLNHVRATLRASIFQVISAASTEGKIPSKQTQSQVLLHLLMLDYMKWIGYKFSASIFEQEASIGGETEFSREFLAKEIGMHGYVDKDIPVLYALIQKTIRDQRGSAGDDVADSLEYLKEAWLKHEQGSSFEEYETKLGGDTTQLDDDHTEQTDNSERTESENSENVTGEESEYASELISRETDEESEEESHNEDKPFVLKR